MTVIEEPPLLVEQAGWYPDPQKEHNLRYHDGLAWTPHVTHFGPTPCRACHPAPASA